MLNIKSSRCTIEGLLYVIDSGKVYIDSSKIIFKQKNSYEYGIIISNHANFSITNSTTSYSGFLICISVANKSEFIMDNVKNENWVTGDVVNSTANFYRVTNAGEWGTWDSSTCSFNRIKNVLSMIPLPKDCQIFPEKGP